MPEGDTLRKIADFMQPRMVGQQVVDATLIFRRAPELTRRSIVDVCAIGKHLLISFGPEGPNGWVLRVHLGMFGSWHTYGKDEAWKRPAKHAQVVLTLGSGQVFVCFHPEDVELSRPAQTAKSSSHKVAKLGPNLLDDPPDMQQILSRAFGQRGDTLLIDVLLNQQIAAGLGNVYKSELMFLQRMHVGATLADVDAQKLQKFFELGTALLQQNLGGWPRTTTYDRRVRYQPQTPRLWVYSRVDKPCLVCQTQIVRATLGRMRRGTYWCPSCQA